MYRYKSSLESLPSNKDKENIVKNVEQKNRLRQRIEEARLKAAEIAPLVEKNSRTRQKLEDAKLCAAIITGEMKGKAEKTEHEFGFFRTKDRNSVLGKRTYNQPKNLICKIIKFK